MREGLHERYEPTLTEDRGIRESKHWFNKFIKPIPQSERYKVWGLITGWDKQNDRPIEDLDEFLNRPRASQGES